MKKLFLIILLGMFAGTLNAQNIAKYEVVSTNVVATVAATPDVVEYPSYRASYTLGKKGGSIEVFSPRSDNAEVKLVSSTGADVCIIHKGTIHEGKNVFSLTSMKISKGIYYVVSKLSAGEQFADRVVIGK